MTVLKSLTEHNMAAKVRIIATGEIMDFAPNSLVAVHRPDTPDTDEYEYPIGEVEIIADGCDNNTRIEFAKAAMQSLLLRGGMANERLARRSFEIADAMMKHLT